jgi:uncharacterized membrane protein
VEGGTVKSLFERRVIRRRLIAGLVVIAPVTATGFVLWWIFQMLDGLLGRFLYPALSRVVPWINLLPGLGLIALVLILIVVGWLAERAIGSRMLGWWQTLLERIPVTRRIYSATNRIVRTMLGREGRPFKEVVLVEYPSPGRYSIGFLAAAAPPVIREHVPDAVSVFIPSTPNPTTGWLAIVPRSTVRVLDMSVDEAFTVVLSGGAVSDATDSVLPGNRPGEVVQPLSPLTP